MSSNVQTTILSGAWRTAPSKLRRVRRDDAATEAARPADEAGEPIGTSGVCEQCGQPARVHVLEGYAGGRPVQRCFCVPCAAASSSCPNQVQPRPLRLRVVLGLAGGVLLLVGLLGDQLIPEGHAGFGWFQRSGVLIGALVLFIGMLVRAEVVAVGGGLLLGASLCADWFDLTRGPGIGWKQQVMLAAGGVCVVLALAGRRVAVFCRARRTGRASWWSRPSGSGDGATDAVGGGPGHDWPGSASIRRACPEAARGDAANRALARSSSAVAAVSTK